MVKDPIFIFGLLLGLLITVFHVISEIRKAKKPKLVNAIVFFLASAGIAAGFKVCILSIDPVISKEFAENRLYIFLGGLAVIWTSVEALLQPLAIRINSTVKQT